MVVSGAGRVVVRLELHVWLEPNVQLEQFDHRLADGIEPPGADHRKGGGPQAGGLLRPGPLDGEAGGIGHHLKPEVRLPALTPVVPKSNPMYRSHAILMDSIQLI